MFRKLGKFVVEHPWHFIAVWLLLFIIFSSLAASFAGRVSYNIEEFIPGSLESVHARDIQIALFNDTPRSQVIVDVRGDPQTTHLFLDRLNDSVYSSSTLRNFTSTTWVYGVQTQVLVAASPGIHHELYSQYDRLADTNARLYHAVDGLRSASPENVSPNGSSIRNAVLDRAGAGMNATGQQFLADAYDLGPNPDSTAMEGYVVGKAGEKLKLNGNTSYLYGLLGLDRNASDSEIRAYANEWTKTHDYTDPEVMPEPVIRSLVNGSDTLFVVNLDANEESPNAQADAMEVRDSAKNLLKEEQFSGLKVWVTGGPAMSIDSEVASMEDMSHIDVISIVLILVLLGLYFRSCLTPIVPLLAIGVGIVICLGLLYVLSLYMSFFYLTLILTVVIMLGAGTDYCVFTLSRYTEERSLGSGVDEAIIAAVEHAGKSVMSSGSTAIIGFGALLIIDFSMFGGMGLGIALGILISIMVATTLLPAIMALTGDRLFWPRKLHYHRVKNPKHSAWTRTTRTVMRHSGLILLLAIIITIPSAILYTHLELGADFISNMAQNTESKQGYDEIVGAFGSGTIGHATVLMTLPSDPRDETGNMSRSGLDQIEKVSRIISGIRGVESVQSTTRPDGTIIDYGNLSGYGPIEGEYYRTYMERSLGSDDRTILMYVTFPGSPASIENGRTIDDIRSALAGYEESTGWDVHFMVGGAAMIHDYQVLSVQQYNLVYIVVFLGIFLVLSALLRSILTPLRLIGTLVMSLFWTAAAYVLLFQNTLHVSTLWMIPIFLFCAMMGLGVDYDIFLVSRVREETLKGLSDEEAIISAVKETGTIITLCGSVMAAAFGSMLISSADELKEMGFVLFFAILLDATLIRMVLVPSIMVLMKKYNWWMPFLDANRHRETPVVEETVRRIADMKKQIFLEDTDDELPSEKQG